MIDFELLLFMRGLYPHRGPLDGSYGLTPGGWLSPALRFRLDAVLPDAERQAVRILSLPHLGHTAGCKCPMRP